MTEGSDGGSGGSGKPPDRPDPSDEAMYRSASNAGWGEPPVTSPAAKGAVAPAPSAAPEKGVPAPPTAPEKTAPTVAPPATAAPLAPPKAPPPPAAQAAAGSLAPTSPPAPAPPRGMTFPAFVPPGAKPAGAAADPRAGAPPAKPIAGGPAQPDAPATRDQDATRGDAQHDDADADHDDEPQRRRSPRTLLLAAAIAAGAAGAAALVLFGYLNSDRYVLACEPERAVPEQGRSFPPWGTRALAGAPWRPLKIAPETRCQSQDTDDPLVLQRAFLAMVLDQATALLTAREVTRVDDAEALLQQALLLTRPAEHEPEPLARQRGEQHQGIERLLGDVAYWRGQAKLRDALGALGDAAKQFDTAVARQPRHVSDAAAWAARVRTLADELRAGSAGPAGPVPTASPAPPSSPEASSPAPEATGSAGHPGVPAGVALPVDPGRTTRPPAPAAPPPDAGPPTGGVLL